MGQKRTKGSRAPIPMGSVVLLALSLSLAAALILPSAATADLQDLCSPGSGAGQCDDPAAVAIDEEASLLYVADQDNNRVDVFDADDNSFVRAFGWGVRTGAGELEACTAETGCQAGHAGGGAGEFQGVASISIDNDPSSPSHRDVFVYGDGRVQRFTAAGEFVAAWGGGVVTGGASATGDLTAGSATVTGVEVTSRFFAPGQTITGSGIPAATTIVGLGNGTIALSKPATASGTEVTLTVAAGEGNVPLDEVQRLSLPAASSVRLRVRTPNPSPSDVTTPRFTGEASVAQVQQLLNDLPNVAPGDITVTGSPGDYTFTFGGRFADTNAFPLPSEGVGQGIDGTTLQDGGGSPELCVPANAVGCTGGVPGAGPGQFSANPVVAVGSKGVVHVADGAAKGESESDGFENRLQRFEADGSFVEEIRPLPGLTEDTEIRAFAVDRSSGRFCAGARVDRMHCFDAAANELAAPPHTANTLAFDGEGNLFLVGHSIDAEGNFLAPPVLGGVHVYDASFAPIRTFYGNGLLGASPTSLARHTSATGDIFAIERSNPRRLHHISFPPPGPVILPFGAQAGQQFPGQKGTRAVEVGNVRATLEAVVNPEGEDTEVRFEYVDHAAYEKDRGEGGDGFEGEGVKEAPPAEAVTIPGDPERYFAEEASHRIECPDPEKELPEGKCLEAETLYHLRAKAANEDGEDTGAEATFQTRPPIGLGAAWSTEVGLESARLHAELDPIGLPTTARFQYVGAAAYEEDKKAGGDGFAAASETEALDFGEGEGLTSRDIVIGSLKPDTIYRYRYVATDFFGVFESPVRSFTTAGPSRPPKGDCPNQALRTGASARLPDCRAYELVSPLDKGNSDIETFTEATLTALGNESQARLDQAAPGGEALAYSSFRAFGDAVSSPFTSQYLARRDAQAGWSSHSLNPPLEGHNLYGSVYLRPMYKGFSEDLCSGWLVQNTDLALTEGAPAGVPNVYRRRNCGGEPYELLIAAPPPGFGKEAEQASSYYLSVGGWSDDGTLSVFKTPGALTSEARMVRVGETLTCAIAASSGGAFGWLRNGAPIAGAAAPDYTTKSADAGKAVQCRIIADEQVAFSNPAQVVAPAPETMPPIAPASLPAPEADGTLEVGGEGGQALTCDARPGDWMGSPTEFAYEWYRNGSSPATGTGATTSKSTVVKSVITASGTGTLTAGSKTVAGVVAENGVFAKGQTVTGVGIPAETTIVAVGEGTLELSQAATASGPQTLSAGAQPFGVGWTITESTANVIPPGTTITAVEGQTLVLSAPAKFTLGKIALAAGPTTPEYTTSGADLAVEANFQCAVTATNAGGSVVTTSASRSTGAPEGEADRGPRAYVLDLYRVYAQKDGEVHLVSVLPNGEATRAHAAVGTRQGYADRRQEDSVVGAVSADGSRIFWSAGTQEPGEPVRIGSGISVGAGPSRLYLRLNPTEEQSPVEEVEPEEFRCTESGKACTLAISTGVARFVAADPQASTALYSEGGNLYEVDVDAAVEAGSAAAMKRLVAAGLKGVAGWSEDLSHVYLVSGALCSASPNSEGKVAEPGKPNLYHYEAGEDCGAGEMDFVATLLDGVADGDGLSFHNRPLDRHSRVSPNGMHAAFMSKASLTGFDNRGATNAEPHSEVFIYDAAAGELRCVSCNPSGARPSGGRPLFEGVGAWVAAQIPSWENQWHAPRVLAEDGRRLFFESFEALVPRDTNGRQDVYQWQEGESRAACEEAGAELFVPDSEGCLSLISSGTSSADSRFVDASASGSDVFFATASSLVFSDYGLIDIYDARVGGGFPPPPTTEGSCEGESCRSPAEPPRQASPSSSQYRGAVQPARRGCAKPAGRARRLSRQARRLRRAARRAHGPRRSRGLRRRAARRAQRARRLTRQAKRCRARAGGQR